MPLTTASQGEKRKPEPLRVLIVDDSEVVCQRLRSMLTELDKVDVRLASQDAEAVVALLQQALPDVVILDLMLEDGPAFRLIRDIKSIDPNITVIVLTNYAFSSYRQACLANGADYFLDKSSEFAQAVDIIEKLRCREAA